ncbi:MAG: adenosine deaminase [Bacilli bacterium]|nr:adenosine deaminase [Bacilli bacterium]
MIDLHLHLDGSLSEEDFRYLANRQNKKLGSDFPNNTHVPDGCTSLEEYLSKFDLPLSFMQDEFSIAYVTSSLVDRLYKLGFIYAEIRFAPQLHTLKGMSQEDAVISAIAGLNNGLKGKTDFDANLILCTMRQADYQTNLETIVLAEKYCKSKVVAVDMAGPEAFHTGDFYIQLFEEAKKRNLNITIHAGEACGSSEVENAIKNLHAQRIGHGIHLNLSMDNIKLIQEKRIGFEFCPTSNLQTKSLSSYNDVPIKDFLRFGIPVTVNSDNMTCSNTNVLHEFAHLNKVFKFSKYELSQLLNNSIDISFTDIKTKEKLRKLLSQRIDSFYLQVISDK